MTPEFIEAMGWEMAEVYGAITDQILINLARYFPLYQPGAKLPQGAFEYQAKMLAQIGKVNRETMAIIRRGLSGADAALKGVLEQAIIDSVQKAEPELVEAVKKGIFAPPQMPVVTPNQMKAFQLYYRQAAQKLNLVNTVMLESTGEAYKQAVGDVANIAQRLQVTQTALDAGAGETITGVSAWNTAVKNSISKMVSNGITGFIDHAGRRWTAEAYVAMDIKTTAMNTGRAAVWETNENFGNDLYLVSYHNGARPLCYDWQNKVISSMNVARDVTDLDGNTVHVYAQAETTYGQAAGLFGVNCKHYPSPFIPGVSIIRGEPQSPEENAKTYAESQTQRAMERKLREERRDVLIAKAQGAPKEEIDRLQAKAQKTSSEIDDFCEETGRARRRNREAVYTKRDFPEADKYDPAQFERQQKDLIDDWFKSGGGQNPPGGNPPQGGAHIGPDDVPPAAQTAIPIQKTETEVVEQPQNEMPIQAGGLTAAEKDAVEYYVSGEGMYINQKLRGRYEAGYAEIESDEKEFIKDLDSALDKPIGKTQTLYRAVDAEAVFGRMTAIEYDSLRSVLAYGSKQKLEVADAEKLILPTIGKTITEKGYMSTTTDYDVALEWGGFTGSEKPIVLKLNTPGSTHGLALSDFEVEDNPQSEVLLARGQRYKVTKVTGEDHSIVVYADILGK